MKGVISYEEVFKFLGAVTAICAGVAGGLFLYNKYKERQDSFDDDFDDDYDDDFSDDEDAEERSYVNIDTPAADDAADKKEKAED